MSTMGEDDFDWSQLDGIEDSVNSQEIVDVTTLPTMDLLTRFQQLTELLKDMEQALKPRTQEARDAHSERYGMLIELRRRGMMK